MWGAGNVAVKNEVRWRSLALVTSRRKTTPPLHCSTTTEPNPPPPLSRARRILWILKHFKFMRFSTLLGGVTVRRTVGRPVVRERDDC